MIVSHKMSSGDPDQKVGSKFRSSLLLKFLLSTTASSHLLGWSSRKETVKGFYYQLIRFRRRELAVKELKDPPPSAPCNFESNTVRL